MVVNGRERRVLLVDDNRSLIRAVAIALSLEGLEPREAHDGLTALEIAVEYRPAAVLIDLALPLLDGFELAARLRALPIFGHPRLVAYTGRSDPRHRASALAAGFDAFLVKPSCFDDIRAALLGHRPTDRNRPRETSEQL